MAAINWGFQRTPEFCVKSGRLKKANWRNGIWVTRVAIIFGVVAIFVGVAKPQLFQEKVIGVVAIGAVALSAAGIALSLWQLELRSRRLRMPVFWASLAVNVILIAVISFLFVRGMGMPELQQNANVRSTPDGP